MATEKRLIDANALVEFLKEQKDKETGAYSKGRNNGINVAIGAIRNEEICPTVDAVEVVHGHMVERIVDRECPWYRVYDCSECGCSVKRWHNYCPNCGAKMDGDGNV